MMMSSKERLKKSALITVALHLAAIAVLFSKPMHLHSRFFSSIGKAPELFLEEENIAILKKNKALEEAFSILDNIHPMKSVGREEKEISFETAPMLESVALSIPEFAQEPPLPLSVPSFAKEVVMEVKLPEASQKKLTLEVSSIKPLDCTLVENIALPTLPASCETLPYFDILPCVEKPFKASLASPEIPLSQQITPALGVAPLCNVPNETVLQRHPVQRADFSISSPQAIVSAQAVASLREYGFPTLQLNEWNEFFDIDVKTYAKEEGGFLFSIHLIPKVDLSEHRLKQNYLFVIDRSNAVDKHRYQTAKRATARAISALRPGDFFNIVILDTTATKLNPAPIAFTKASVAQAEVFLEKQSSHSPNYQGAATDIYTALTKILSSEMQAEEVITAILISDGDSPLKSNQQRKKIASWLEANHDRITLYTATAGQGNNLSSLKMLSLASRGSLLYSDTHAAFPRRLAKLVMDLRYPIAKEMSVSIVPSEDAGDIEILPPSSRLPNLFSDHPYVLTGSCTTLTDFTLLLEGKNKDRLFSIKKTISLSTAKPGARLLSKQWAEEKAHTLFDQYLREGQPAVLKQAEKQLDHDAKNSRR